MADIEAIFEDFEASIKPCLVDFKHCVQVKLEASLNKRFDCLFKSFINPKTLNQEQYDQLKGEFMENLMDTLKSRYEKALNEPDMLARVAEIDPKRKYTFEMEEATLVAKSLKPIKEEMLIELDQTRNQANQIKDAEEKISESLLSELEETRNRHRLMKKESSKAREAMAGLF